MSIPLVLGYTHSRLIHMRWETGGRSPAGGWNRSVEMDCGMEGKIPDAVLSLGGVTLSQPRVQSSGLGTINSPNPVPQPT